MLGCSYRVLALCFAVAVALAVALTTAITSGDPPGKSKDIALRFDRSALKISKFGSRDIVSLRQARCKRPDDPAGAPQLPARFVRMLVPRRAKFEKVTITGCRTQELPGKFDIDFVRPPCRPGQKPPPAGPDAKIYGSDKPYPPQKVEFLRSGTMRGHRLFFLRVNPVQYLPKDKKLLFHSQVRIRVEYGLDNARTLTLRPRGKSREFRRMLEKFVVKRKFATHRRIYLDASPIRELRADAPPFFVLHGRDDSLIPVGEAQDFVQELRAVSKSPVAYAELPHAQHGFDIFNSPRAHKSAEAVARFLSWVYATNPPAT